MYSLIIKISLFLAGNFFRINNRLRAILFGTETKIDTKNLSYSYYINEIDKFDITAKLLSNNVLQLKKGTTVHNIWRAYTDLDGEGSLKLAGDKVICYSMIHEAGLPVPNSVVISSGDFRSAIAFENKIKGPIVVKPAKNTGDSRGVTIRPEGFYSIWMAVNYAGLYGKKVIVEEFVEGTNYRLLYCKGKFLSACARLPAQVVGDGSSTIRELIKKENIGRMEQGEIKEYSRRTRPILYKIEITGLLIKWLKKQNNTLGSIPEKGEVVQLHEICHWLKGGQYIDVTESISKNYVNLGKKAVQILGIKLAGVDMIIQDIEKEKSKVIINEVNTSPHLLIHYEVQNQEKVKSVAKRIIKTMFDIN